MKQKQTHRYRKQTNGCQLPEKSGIGYGQKREKIKK